MDFLDLLTSTSARALAFSTPLLWAALGEIYAERAGVVNLGVEGMMILGAVAGFIVGQTSGSPLLGLVLAAGVGGVAALVHAFIAVTLRANQYVSGLALTIFGLGLSGLLGREWVGQPLVNSMTFVTVPVLSEVPVLGPVLFTDQYLLTYAGLVAAALLWFVLHHTRLGMTLRTVGEAPVAADVAGINVMAVRYGAVAFGGVMAGIAGAYLSVAYRPSWGEGMTNGMGWIALAMAIFALWDPLRAVGAAFLFGAFFTLSFRLQNVFPPELLTLMPYVFTIVALTLVALGKGARSFGAPAALGQPYQRGER
ncbi:MAG: ABC transporter permease [Trueperaceae bacterium]|nr:MAG: ABC transporter permease [Trueperaceae bacterium]